VTLETRIAEMLDEALTTRQTIMAPLGSNPDELLAALADVRARLDRVEELLASGLRLRGQARRAAEDASFAADVAWAQALESIKSAPVRRGGSDSFEGPRERYAQADLAIFDAKRHTRALARQASEMDDYVEVLRLTLRGLDGVRSDLLVMLRAFQVEARLER
jgi:hypothetical protein